MAAPRFGLEGDAALTEPVNPVIDLPSAVGEPVEANVDGSSDGIIAKAR
jgi:hypothetical protein